MIEARFGPRQAEQAWRLFDETTPPCGIPSLIYLLEDAVGRLMLDGNEALYPGDIYIGPLPQAPHAEPGLPLRGIQIAMPALQAAAQRLCKTQIPVVTAPGSRTRLLAGRIKQCSSPLPWPGALIDLRLDATMGWTLPCQCKARIIVVSGELQYRDTPIRAGSEQLVSDTATLYANQRSHALIWLDADDQPGD
ncbi:hypothetical protein JHS3_11270 [Jeongeupia sp. HS-3]|uniref:hypothetical protein n=1 Tax=Jeongeupia sp. HS-3 TaxID=1009682 RepID=UPI0018A3A49C|nr:hypothetical protein [Jeongeupia sp. HS-3]BCL75391.1 hypothetical protein JHS3_11270 [Jeongeupia sp. HS-3]